MASESYLKDIMRPGVLNDRLRSRRATITTQEKVDEVNDFLQIHSRSGVWSVEETSSIPQTTTYRSRIEHLLLEPDKTPYVQHLTDGP